MVHSMELRFTNNPNAVFYAGQVLAGTLELRLGSSVKARRLRLIVKGKAECKWSETKGSGRNSRTKCYSAKAIYLNTVTYFFGSDGGSSIEVPVGVHTYNFECLLPGSLPYTLAGKHGFVRYKVEATLDIPWGFDYEKERPFTVVRHDDLNLVRFPNYRLPCEFEIIKKFSCLCWESDPLILTMRVPRTGFGLGERIPIHIQIVNRSTTDVYSTEFRLNKVEQFNSTSKTKIYKSVVTSKFSRGVRKGQTVNFDEFLEIPRVLSTSSDRFCNVFQIKYYVSFKARTGGFGKSPKMAIGISIGNVGIVDVVVSAPPVPAHSQIQQVRPTAPLSVPETLDDLPPSFEEATKDGVPTFEESQLMKYSA